jgi:molybdopterin-guanine dinucleotide biosynthesis protein A
MGVPKATLPFGPETMLQRVVRLLGTVVAPIVVVAARGQELLELPPGVVVTRDERESRGPLEGLRAGLSALPEAVDAAYVTSCDVPLLVPAFAQRMFDLLGEHDIAVMEIDGFTHPLSAVYRRTTLPHIESLLAAGSVATCVSFRCRSDAAREGGGDGRRRSTAQYAAESQHARGLFGCAHGRRIRLTHRPQGRPYDSFSK